MTVALPLFTAGDQGYAIPEKALRRWATERLSAEPRTGGGIVYSLTISGSTCNNVPLEVVMTVAVDADGRIDATLSRPVGAGRGCDAMCAAHGDGRRLLAEVGTCDEVLGLTLNEAAFRNWEAEPSGCFCTAGNRRH